CRMSVENFVTQCFYNLSIEERIHYFESPHGARLRNVYRKFWGMMNLPFAVFGIILSSCFIITATNAIYRKKVSRKCYVLLLNRTIGDVITCSMSLLICLYILLAREIQLYYIIYLTKIIYVSRVYRSALRYVALSVIKLLAVARPFEYRICVTIKKSVHVVIISWVIFALMLSYILSALVKVPYLNELTNCTMETCIRFKHWSSNLLSVLLYFFTLSVFGITLILVKRERRYGDSFKSQRSIKKRRKTSRFPFWKLSLNVLSYALLNLFYIIWCIGQLVSTNHCFFLRNYIEFERIYAFVILSSLIRICIDPVVCFVTDVQVTQLHINLRFFSKKIT
ncbi:hypothetical protein PENTCL1PPCAC_738, partial [Pristionchus entomophagus]